MLLDYQLYFPCDILQSSKQFTHRSSNTYMRPCNGTVSSVRSTTSRHALMVYPCPFASSCMYAWECAKRAEDKSCAPHPGTAPTGSPSTHSTSGAGNGLMTALLSAACSGLGSVGDGGSVDVDGGRSTAVIRMRMGEASRSSMENTSRPLGARQRRARANTAPRAPT